MKKRLSSFIIFAMILAMQSCGCAKRPSDDDRVLATVSNRRITLREFKKRISRLPLYYRSIVEKDEKKYLNEMIAETIFYEEAVRRGLDRESDVADLINEAKKKIIISKLFKNDIEDKVKVTEDEVSAYYESHKDEFKTPPLWRASHILVSNEREAKDLLDALSKGANFEELAKGHSTDATAIRGGDIGYFRAGQLVPDFEKASLKLEVGQVSDIVHTQFGYHIIKLTDKRGPAPEDYEKTRRLIENELKNEQRRILFDNLIAELRARYGVKVEDGALNALDSMGGEEKGKVADKQS